MDSRYRKFLALAEAGSFSAAARQLRVTQPAITLAVASLEHALGVRLYVRRSRPIVLTHEGQIVASAARHMAAEYEHMFMQLRAELPTERVRIGLIDSIAHLLYGADAELSSLSNVDVLVDNSHRIMHDLRDGRIDLGIITGQPATLGGDVMIHKLHDEEFVFVAAPARTVGKKAGQVDDWLATNPESTTYEHFLRLFKREHLRVTPVFHSASMELLRDMAIAGKGTALLPRHIVKSALETGTLAVVEARPLYRPVWAITLRTHVLPAAQTIGAYVDRLLAGTPG